MEEKDKQNQQNNKKAEEGCPLCQISDDTIKKLKEGRDKNKEDFKNGESAIN